MDGQTGRKSRKFDSFKNHIQKFSWISVVIGRVRFTKPKRSGEIAYELFCEWASNWNDITYFTFIQVISGQEMRAKMKK